MKALTKAAFEEFINIELYEKAFDKQVNLNYLQLIAVKVLAFTNSDVMINKQGKESILNWCTSGYPLERWYDFSAKELGISIEFPELYACYERKQQATADLAVSAEELKTCALKRISLDAAKVAE